MFLPLQLNLCNDKFLSTIYNCLSDCHLDVLILNVFTCIEWVWPVTIATGGGPSKTVVGGSSSSLWKASLWTQLEKLSNSLWKLYRQVLVNMYMYRLYVYM